MNPRLSYCCHYCELAIAPARVKSISRTKDGKVAIEHRCECKDFVIAAKYPFNLPAVQTLTRVFPWENPQTLKTNEEIDVEVGVWAVDLDGIDTVEDFERMCELRSS